VNSAVPPACSAALPASFTISAIRNLTCAAVSFFGVSGRACPFARSWGSASADSRISAPGVPSMCLKN
jgi:hypothetical protein